jgi:hypothetical protein
LHTIATSNQPEICTRTPKVEGIHDDRSTSAQSTAITAASLTPEGEKRITSLARGRERCEPVVSELILVKAVLAEIPLEYSIAE